MPQVERLGGRRHEFGSDRIRHCRLGYAHNLLALLPGKVPSHHFVNRIELIGPASPPQRGAHSRLYPAPIGARGG